MKEDDSRSVEEEKMKYSLDLNIISINGNITSYLGNIFDSNESGKYIGYFILIFWINKVHRLLNY